MGINDCLVSIQQCCFHDLPILDVHAADGPIFVFHGKLSFCPPWNKIDFTGRQVLRAFNAYKDGMKQRRQEKKEKKEAAKHGHEVHDEL